MGQPRKNVVRTRQANLPDDDTRRKLSLSHTRNLEHFYRFRRVSTEPKTAWTFTVELFYPHFISVKTYKPCILRIPTETSECPLRSFEMLCHAQRPTIHSRAHTFSSDVFHRKNAYFLRSTSMSTYYLAIQNTPRLHWANLLMAGRQLGIPSTVIRECTCERIALCISLNRFSQWGAFPRARLCVCSQMSIAIAI